MSRLRRNMAKRKLSELLSVAEDESFLIMIWAVDALQSGREATASRFLTYPPEAASAKFGDRYYANKWLLETLVNELLVTKKKAPTSGLLSRVLNCSQFSTLATCLNALHKLENAEDAMILQRTNVIDLMPRLAQRQFEWQRGFLSRSQIFRALHVYGGPQCAQYFESAYGLSLNDFFLAGFAFLAMSRETPGFQRSCEVGAIGISEATREKALSLMEVSIEAARSQAFSLRDGVTSTAYNKSILRRTPLISFGDRTQRIRAPLPDLISQRITTGIYYDLVNGGSEIWREIGSRFETYCFKLISRLLPSKQIRQSYSYHFQKPLDTPDILFGCNSRVDVVIECKAKKMTFEAKFSEDPLLEARKGFSEIIKGVVQLWKFFSHCRRSIVQEQLADEVVGVVLTLDPWLDMSRLHDRIFAEANALVAAESAILEQDKRPIIFCSIDDFENTLERSSENGLIAAIRAAATDQYRGWYLYNVHQNILPGERCNNDYPFETELDQLKDRWQAIA